MQYKDISFTVWDAGSRSKIMQLWRHYYKNTQALIFVVDSNDRERICAQTDDGYFSDINAKEILHDMMKEEELKDAVLLVLANKQDLPNCMSIDEISERLGLNKITNRIHGIMGCSALENTGLNEAVNWIAQNIDKRIIITNDPISVSDSKLLTQR